MLAEQWVGEEGVSQVQVTALYPRPASGQLELFAESQHLIEHDKANAVMDAVNRRYGEFALAPARLLNRPDMPNVIAPAWKPYGHRQTI
jgi:DNA polymerase-4